MQKTISNRPIQAIIVTGAGRSFMVGGRECVSRQLGNYRGFCPQKHQCLFRIGEAASMRDRSIDGFALGAGNDWL